jgi:hypothetical protein
LIFQGLIQPYIVGRLIGLSLGEYLWTTFSRPAAIALCGMPLLAAIHTTAIGQGWSTFFLQAAAATGTVLGLIVLLGMDSAERRRFVLRPLGQLVAALNSRRLLISGTNSEK